MNHYEPQLWSALESAQAVEDFEVRQAQLEDVVSGAEAGGFARLAFAARHALANAYCVGRQWDRAFPLFARCLIEHDARRHELGPDEEAALLSWYCWIIQTMAEFPAIGLPRMYKALDDVEQRFRMAGQDLREVYATRRSVAHIVADWEQEQHYFEQWTAARGPEPMRMWDFAVQVDRLTDRGDDAAAFQLAAPALAGARTFDEPPVPVHIDMLLPLARLGKHAEARRSYRLARRGITRDVYRYEYSGKLIEFCALTGNLDAGLETVSMMMWGFATLNRPTGKMDFAVAVAVLMQQMVDAGRGEEPVGWAKQGEDEYVNAAQLLERMRGIALDLAAQFDARNGTTSQGDRARARLAARPVARFRVSAASYRFTESIPEDLSAEELLDRVQWHVDRGQRTAARDHLRALGEPPSSLAARRAHLVALLSNGPDAGSDLHEAAGQYQAEDDVISMALCLCDVAMWMADNEKLDDAIPLVTGMRDVLCQLPDPKTVALAEFAFANVVVRADTEGADRALARAAEHAAESGDPYVLALVAGRQTHWAVQDQLPPDQVIALATAMRDAALDADWPAQVVRAFSHLETAHAKAGTAAEYHREIDERIAGFPSDTPHLVRVGFGYAQARRFIDEGREAEAVPALEQLIAAERFGGVPTLHWHWLAQGYFAAGRLEDAVDAAEVDADYLDELRERGGLEQPSTADVNRKLLVECYRRLGDLQGALEQLETLSRNAHKREDAQLQEYVRAQFDQVRVAMTARS
jgi:tetratricopeptide (TPR) repeat protein